MNGRSPCPDRRRILLAGLVTVLAPTGALAGEPAFQGTLDRAGARRLAVFAEGNIDTLCRIEVSVAANSAGGSATLEESALVVKADDGKLEFRFPVGSVKARGKVFRAGGLLTPMRGEPEDGLKRYEFNMLG